MKKTLLITACMLFLIALVTPTVKAQEWSTGLDIYSSYLWRGAKFGTGAALQPGVEFSAGGFSAGAWGSYSTGAEEAAEADLYVGYGFDLSEKATLSFTVTDYYFPGDAMYLDGKSHYFEPMVSLGLGSFSLMGAYMMNDGAGDVYFEAGLSAGPVDLALGGGDGAYTVDGDFNICNISIGTSKEIKITDSFSLPVSAAVVLNPSSEQFNIAVGISL